MFIAKSTTLVMYIGMTIGVTIKIIYTSIFIDCDLTGIVLCAIAHTVFVFLPHC